MKHQASNLKEDFKKISISRILKENSQIEFND